MNTIFMGSTYICKNYWVTEACWLDTFCSELLILAYLVWAKYCTGHGFQEKPWGQLGTKFSDLHLVTGKGLSISEKHCIVSCKKKKKWSHCKWLPFTCEWNAGQIQTWMTNVSHSSQTTKRFSLPIWQTRQSALSSKAVILGTTTL